MAVHGVQVQGPAGPPAAAVGCLPCHLAHPPSQPPAQAPTRRLQRGGQLRGLINLIRAEAQQQVAWHSVACSRQEGAAAQGRLRSADGAGSRNATAAALLHLLLLRRRHHTNNRRPSAACTAQSQERTLPDDAAALLGRRRELLQSSRGRTAPRMGKLRAGRPAAAAPSAPHRSLRECWPPGCALRPRLSPAPRWQCLGKLGSAAPAAG